MTLMDAHRDGRRQRVTAISSRTSSGQGSTYNGSEVAARKTFALLHGFGLAPAAFRQVEDHLRREGHDVIAPSLLNVKGLWSLEASAAGVAGQLARHSDGPVVVVGHSFGGGVATAFVDGFPDRVDHLILVDSVALPQHGRGLGDWIRPFPAYISSLPLQAVVRIMAAYAVDPYRCLHWISAGAWCLHADLSEMMRRIAARGIEASVLWGTDDRLLDPSVGRQIAGLLRADFSAVSGDHDWPLRNPAGFATLLSELATARPAARAG